MEKMILPLRYIFISQGMGGSFSHKGTLAIDFAGREVKNRNLYAPFTGIVKYIFNNGNWVWLESKDKVRFADGTADYATLMIGHCNDISHLRVGQKIEQGTHFYTMGTAGNATGVHVHLELGRGKFKIGGWFRNSHGIWMIHNAIDPTKTMFITEDTVIAQSQYTWTRLLGTPVKRDTNREQIEVKAWNLRCRNTPNGSVLGFINEGIYNVLGTQKQGSYTWYNIEKDKWIAYDKSWAILHPKQESELDKYKKENTELKSKIKELETELSRYTPIQAYVKK